MTVIVADSGVPTPLYEELAVLALEEPLMLSELLEAPELRVKDRSDEGGTAVYETLLERVPESTGIGGPVEEKLKLSVLMDSAVLSTTVSDPEYEPVLGVTRG